MEKLFNIKVFNIDEWRKNTTWTCPWCGHGIKGDTCSCLRAFFVYNNENENCRQIVFYRAGSLIAIPRFGLVFTNGKELCKAFSIDEENNFSFENEVLVREKYRLDCIETKYLKDAFPAISPMESK